MFSINYAFQIMHDIKLELPVLARVITYGSNDKSEKVDMINQKKCVGSSLFLEMCTIKTQ